MNINIIRAPNHLGDCIMALAALKPLPEDFKYYLLAPEWSQCLYAELPGVELIPIPKEYLHGLPAITYQKNIIKELSAERGLLLTPSFSSALIMLLGGVKHRFGYASDHRGMLLSNPVSTNQRIIHRSDLYLHLLEVFFDAKFEKQMPRLHAKHDVSIRDKLAHQFGVVGNDKYMVVAAQAVAQSRRWGSANYAELAGLIYEKHGYKTILLGTDGEYEAGAKIQQSKDYVINLCGKTGLDDAVCLLSGAEVFVGNDSGLAHLAGASGIPIVVLSGADDPRETSPLAEEKTVIYKDHLDCISCVKNKCPLSGDKFMQCMKEISVAEVFAAVDSYLS